MSNDKTDLIALTIDQIKSRLSILEESVVFIKNELPPNLSHRLFNIQSSLSNINKHNNSETKSSNCITSPPPKNLVDPNFNVISIIDDHSVHIEKYKRYLKKHLNNTIQKQLSELDDKMKRIEQDFIPFKNTATSTITTSENTFTELENQIKKSFNDFNTECQDLYGKISDTQIQKKFAYEKASNHLTKSLDMQIKHQQKEIETLKIEIDETQELLNTINLEKKAKNDKSKHEILLTKQNEKNIIQEQAEKINVLNIQWANARDILTNQLSAIDERFDTLLKSAENMDNSLKNYKRKFSVYQIGRKKIDENFAIIQDQLNDEFIILDRSNLKVDIARFELNVTVSLENDQEQIENLESYVNSLYDKLTESFST